MDVIFLGIKGYEFLNEYITYNIHYNILLPYTFCHMKFSMKSPVLRLSSRFSTKQSAKINGWTGKWNHILQQLPELIDWLFAKCNWVSATSLQQTFNNWYSWDRACTKLYQRTATICSRLISEWAALLLRYLKIVFLMTRHCQNTLGGWIVNKETIWSVFLYKALQKEINTV